MKVKVYTMNSKNVFFFYAVLSFFCTLMVDARSITIQQKIDWPQFMSNQDMIWEVLPEYWHESAYLGNGRLGLMIYKEPEKNYIRLETSNCDVHDHREKRDVFGTPDCLPVTLHCIPKEKSSVVKCALIFGMQRLQQISLLRKGVFI